MQESELEIFRQHYCTPKKLGRLAGLRPETVRPRLANKSQLTGQKTRCKRGWTALRIPRSVIRHVHGRLFFHDQNESLRLTCDFSYRRNNNGIYV